MPFDIADFTSLDAYPAYRGVNLHAKGNIEDDPEREAKDFALQNGRMINYAAGILYRLKVPVVAPLASLIPLYQHLAKTRYGSAIAPAMFLVEAINTTTEILTITAHPFVDEDVVYVTWGETAPTLSAGSLSRTTAYYVNNLTADTLSLHPTANDASANTAAINFTAAGTGGFWLTRQFPLVVNRRTDVARTYLNAMPVKYPGLDLNGGELFWNGNLEWACYPKRGAAVADAAAAFYTEGSAAYTSPTWDTAGILTSQDVSLAWGAAPFDAFFGEEGVSLSFEPQFAKKGNGIFPHATDILTGCKVTAKVKPIGLTVPQFMALFAEQLGAQLTSNNMVITVGGYTITLYAAQLKSPKSLTFSQKDGLCPELEFEAMGNATSDNKPPFLIA